MKCFVLFIFVVFLSACGVGESVNEALIFEGISDTTDSFSAETTRINTSSTKETNSKPTATAIETTETASIVTDTDFGQYNDLVISEIITAPNIIFILSHNFQDRNICGYFITDLGEIKSFDFREDEPDKTYDIKSVYNKLQKIGIETEYEDINADDLEKYSKLLSQVSLGGNLERPDGIGVFPDVEEGTFNYYGVKSGSIVHLGKFADGGGDLTSVDKNAVELVSLLRKEAFPKNSDFYYN